MLPNSSVEKNLFIVLFLNSIFPLTPGLRSFLAEKVKSRSFKKNEIVSREGEICNRLYLIKTGMVRGYFKIGASEITTWVDTENEVFTSITGFFRHQPGKEFIQCVEETHCDYLEYEDYRYCLNNFPEMNHISRILLEEYYIMAEHRVFLSRIPNASQRLSHFMESNKWDIINRIPKKYLASLLSMRPETLSRLLKEKQREEKSIGKGSDYKMA
ncbi:Crp/Fnr family transcriptional regulator [Zobellia uliginosa]|uniref:Crp/Fnr family transcriptional regulator n=1 Tax=Zobellia uliginosa TaxID=143224 RepID=UPI0026E33267|nr:Crp/Fnr family transcriptional regulator [Zobellia uliginosa]MDO6519330.1 Crp/Fnr family transcriptional regulator [Zobellia uliginosa]